MLVSSQRMSWASSVGLLNHNDCVLLLRALTALLSILHAESREMESEKLRGDHITLHSQIMFNF